MAREGAARLTRPGRCLGPGALFGVWLVTHLLAPIACAREDAAPHGCAGDDCDDAWLLARYRPAPPDASGRGWDGAGDARGVPLQGTWVHIPGGSFDMGCVPGDRNCRPWEEPRHPVTVQDFDLLQAEVTQGQYLEATGTNPSGFASCGLDCPVEQISWYEARAFCAAMGGRLPSEAEWEYAARAGAATVYPCGDDDACLDGVAWYVRNSDGRTHPVETRAANAFGVHDMLGNVWEWVADCPHVDYVGAPATGDVWDGGDCTERVLRGGCLANEAYLLRASTRLAIGPENRIDLSGVRCAR